jgi:hypothetical protein
LLVLIVGFLAITIAFASHYSHDDTHDPSH